MFQQQHGQHFGGSGFAGARQTGEPDTGTLAVAGRVRVRQDLGRFGSREPGGQSLAAIQELVAYLGA